MLPGPFLSLGVFLLLIMLYLNIFFLKIHKIQKKRVKTEATLGYTITKITIIFLSSKDWGKAMDALNELRIIYMLYTSHPRHLFMQCMHVGKWICLHNNTTKYTSLYVTEIYKKWATLIINISIRVFFNIFKWMSHFLYFHLNCFKIINNSVLYMNTSYFCSCPYPRLSTDNQHWQC